MLTVIERSSIVSFDHNSERQEMPRIKRKQYTKEFSELASTSAEHREHNDCAVKAVAILTKKPYGEVLAAFDAVGRKRGRGVLNRLIHAVAEQLGLTLARVSVDDFISQYTGSHSVLKNITTHHPDRFPKVWKNGKSYLALTKGHCLAIVNGTTHDWTHDRAIRINYIYEVTKCK